jgi:hypothetical protein
VRKGRIIYLAHPVFSIYYAHGAVAYRQYIANAIRMLLGEDITLETNMPSTARVTLMDQKPKNRYVLHLLYANTISRGAQVNLSPEGYVRDSNRIEIIEELLPLRDVEISLNLPRKIRRVTLEPQGEEIDIQLANSKVKIKIAEFTCHQMVVLDY